MTDVIFALLLAAAPAPANAATPLGLASVEMSFGGIVSRSAQFLVDLEHRRVRITLGREVTERDVPAEAASGIEAAARDVLRDGDVYSHLRCPGPPREPVINSTADVRLRFVDGSQAGWGIHRGCETVAIERLQAALSALETAPEPQR